METSTIIIIAIALICFFLVIKIFNSLNIYRNRYKNAFGQIEVQLKRRYDLIPNIIEVAKAYMAHEKETLENVINARNQAAAGLKKASDNLNNPSAIKELTQAENNLQSALGGFNLVMEAYPDLKASQNMMQLTEEITSTENKISFARQSFNDQVTNYNTYKQNFPAVVFANLFGHKDDAQLLEFADSEKIQEAPKVAF